MQSDWRITTRAPQSRVTPVDALLWTVMMACAQPWAHHLMYWRGQLGHEPWRWLTGHWVHANGMHLILNALALGLLPFILPAPSRRQWWAWLLLLSIMISASLFFFNPVLQQYVGLSGVLHGLYVATAIAAWPQRSERRWIGGVLCALLLKLLIEPHLPHTPTEKLIGVSVFFVAHQVGAFWGGVLGVLTLYCNKHPFFAIRVSKTHL